jgi:hypothetical protein
LAAGADPGGNIGDRDAAFYDPPARTAASTRDDRAPLGRLRGVALFCGEAGVITPLRIHTHAGSTACANPTVTNARLPDGRRRPDRHLLHPVEGAGRNEAGTLVFWRAYD